MAELPKEKPLVARFFYRKREYPCQENLANFIDLTEEKRAPH
jgi:hypothetical protein